MFIGRKDKITLYDILMILVLDVLLMIFFFKGYFMLIGLEPRKMVVILGGMLLAPFMLMVPRISIVLFIIFSSFAQANIHLGEYFDLSFVDIFTITIGLAIGLHLLFGTIDFTLPKARILVPTLIVCAMACIIGFIHSTRVENPELLGFHVKNMLLWIILFLIIASTIHSERLIHLTVYAVLTSIIISSLWALTSVEEIDLWGAIQGQSAARIHNYAFTHANLVGQFLVLTIPFAFFGFLYSKSMLMKAFGFWAFMIGGVALLLTFSRASWLATVGGIMFVMLRERKKILRFLFGFVVLFLFLEFMSNIIIGISLYDLLVARFGQIEESQLSMRPFIWSVSLRLIVANPLLGVGAGFYPDAYWMDIDVIYRRQHAHNTFFHLAAEWGIIFAVLFIVWYGRILLDLFRALKKDMTTSATILSLSLMAGLTGITFVMLFEHILYSPLIGTLFFILCGLSVSLVKKVRHDEATLLRP